MATLDPTRLRNPVWPTVLILTGGALLGTIIGSFLLLTFGLVVLIPLGPLAFFFYVPLVMAQSAAASSLTFLIVPAWAALGGYWAAHMTAGFGGVAGGLGVTFFSDSHPVYRRANELAADLNLPPIKWVGWFPDGAINAFAVGLKQDNALVAFSQGAIEKLTMEELDAVMAHELAHVANNDMARMTYIRGVQNALTWFLIFRGMKNIALWLFTPTSQLELMRFSRQREYWADAVAAVLTSPQAIAGALAAIGKDKAEPPKQQRAYANFMLRANAHSWLATHPPIADRISAIEEGRFIRQLPLLDGETPQELPGGAPVAAVKPAPVRASER